MKWKAKWGVKGKLEKERVEKKSRSLPPPQKKKIDDAKTKEEKRIWGIKKNENSQVLAKRKKLGKGRRLRLVANRVKNWWNLIKKDKQTWRYEGKREMPKEEPSDINSTEA